MLTMDAREARGMPLIQARLSAQLGAEFETDLLHAGDYAALDTPLALGIERKSLSNYVSSLASGELDEQLARMADLYDIPVLLVEGFPKPQGDGKVRLYAGGKREFSYAWLLASCVAWFGRGVWPLFVESLESTPYAVATLYRVVAKGQHRNTYRPKKTLPSLHPMSTVAKMLLQLPGIGEQRAATQADESIADLCALDEAAWISRLGKVTGARVYAELRRKPDG